MNRALLAPDRRVASVWLVAAAVMFVAAAFAGDQDFARATTTYGNFDVPSDRAGIEALAPGFGGIEPVIAKLEKAPLAQAS